jgi:hypothetical protein
MLRPTAASLVQFHSVDPVQVYPCLRPIDESESRPKKAVLSRLQVKALIGYPLFCRVVLYKLSVLKTPLSTP